jgi:formylglycine-generating enzyme required for sulfatase activity
MNLILRGGSWDEQIVNYARARAEGNRPPTTRYSVLGFRFIRRETGP